VYLSCVAGLLLQGDGGGGGGGDDVDHHCLRGGDYDDATEVPLLI